MSIEDKKLGMGGKLAITGTIVGAAFITAAIQVPDTKEIHACKGIGGSAIVERIMRDNNRTLMIFTAGPKSIFSERAFTQAPSAKAIAHADAFCSGQKSQLTPVIPS